MDELRLAAATLADLLALIEAGTISGKIGKQLLPDLFQVPRVSECVAPMTACCLSLLRVRHCGRYFL